MESNLPEIIKFESLNEFLKYNKSVIDAHHYKHMYLIKLVEKIYQGEYEVFNMYNIIDKSGLSILCLHVTSHYLLYSFKWTDEMLELLSKQVDLKMATVRFDFTGNKELILQLFKKQNEPFEIFKERIAHQCEELNEITVDIEGSTELCTFKDFKRLTQLAYEYHLEEYGSHAFRDFNSVSNLIEKGIRAKTFYLYRDNGRICCMAQVFDKQSGYPLIGGLVTAKNERNKGYATAFLYDLTEMLFDEGFSKCGLVSDTSNPSSNKVFRRVGYIPLYEYISMHTLNPSAYAE